MAHRLSLLGHEIVFHAKKMPWFVSDVIPADLQYLLDNFSRGSDPNLVAMADEWRRLIESGVWDFQYDLFWTSAHSYWYMDSVAPHVFRDFCACDLVIFKGDLNYRKMVHDANWPPGTDLFDAIGPIGAKISFPFVMLRTCKSDTVAGVGESVFENLNLLDSDWMTNGKFGMIQLFQ